MNFSELKQHLVHYGTKVLILACILVASTEVAQAKWIDDIAKGVFEICVSIGAFILAMGSMLLDGVIHYTVVQMGQWFANNSNSGGMGLGQAVSLGWTLIRDFVNIFFIFGLIYIGIRTILKSEDSNTRRLLGLLIAAALLVNFSLYATQLLVDFSNLAASAVYKQIAGNSTGLTNKTMYDTPIANGFLKASKLTSWLDGNASANKMLPEKIDTGGIFIYGFMILIFFSVAGFTFLLACITFITRFVALILYMVFSPLMFMQWIFPKLGQLGDRWWQGFFQYTLYAPIYIFMIYISINMFKGLVSATSSFYDVEKSAGGSLLADKPGSSIGIIVLNFLVMIGLLWASMKVGDYMSIKGGNFAYSTMQRGAQRVGRGARNFATNTASSAAGAAGAAAWAIRSPMRKWNIDRKIKNYDHFAKLAETSEDETVRNYAKMRLWGMGGERGREATVKARDWAPEGRQSVDAREKREKTQKNRALQAAQKDNFMSDMKAGAAADITTPEGRDKRIKMESRMGKATEKDIIEIAKDKDDQKVLLDVAGAMPEAKFNKMMESDDVDTGFKEQMRQRRKEQVIDRLTALKPGQTTRPTLAEVITKAEIADLNAIGYDEVIKHANYLTDKQIGDWKLPPTANSMLRTERTNLLKAQMNDPDVARATANAEAIFKRYNKESERAALDIEILNHDRAAPHIADKTSLDKIITTKEGMSATEKTGIRDKTLGYLETTANNAKIEYERLDNEVFMAQRDGAAVEVIAELKSKRDDAEKEKNKASDRHNDLIEWFKTDRNGKKYNA